MELFIIFILILLNGFLSMAEVALITVKKSRLKHLSSEGNLNAEIALQMAENPNRFFSTVQVGITLIGILTGAISGVALSDPLSRLFHTIGLNAGLADSLGFGIVVVFVTYLSLVIGELVPKRLGMNFSEKITLMVAGPMYNIAKIFNPFVDVLSGSTEFVMDIFHLKAKKKLPVSEEEVRLLIQEGAQMGVFEAIEKNIVEKVLNIGDAKVTALMKARNKVVWLDIKASDKDLIDTILANQYSYFPVADGELDNIIGVLRTDSFLAETIEKQGKRLDLKSLLHKPLLIPENKKVLDALELFKRMRIHLGIIIDEYGNVQGILTLTDILESIVGDIPDINEQEDAQIIRRNKNTWFVDGLVSNVYFKEFFKVQELPDEEEELYNTIGGFVMNELGMVPVVGDKVEINGYSLEVADMDGNRVDKLLVHKNE